LQIADKAFLIADFRLQICKDIVHKRKSNRLQGYDYSLPGAYFVTLVAKDRQTLFGATSEDRIHLSAFGKIVKEEWIHSIVMRKELRLDKFVVMPDHLHSVVFVDDLSPAKQVTSIEAVGAHGRAPQHRKPRTLGALVAAFKAVSTRKARALAGDPELLIWQRNYHDRVIRNQIELDRIREYIAYNPLKLSEGW
jgi:putative transposase